MAKNSLFPAFIQMFYSSAYAPHVMTLPINTWSPISSGHDAGTALAWDGSQQDVITEMDFLTDKLALLAPASVNINSYTVWTMASEDANPQYQVSVDVSKVGTNASTNQSKAVQTQYNMLDTEGQKVKLVLLDFPYIGWDRTTGFDALTSTERDVLGKLMDELSFFSSRNGKRPAVFRSRTTKLNDKLRRAYRMS